MCRRALPLAAWLCLTLAPCLIGTVGAIGAAQPPERALEGAAARAAAHLVHIERLDRRRGEIEIARDSARVATTRRLYPSELRVGLFRVATTPDLQGLIVPAVQEVSRELQPLLDQPARDAIQSWTVSVRRVEATERRFYGFDPFIVSIRHGERYIPTEYGDSFLATTKLREHLRQLVVIATAGTFDRELHSWLFTSPISPLPPSERVESSARLDLATADAHSARRCVRGDLPSCATLLAIHGVPADPLHTWYAPEDYRALTSLIALQRGDGPDARALQRACAAGSQRDCERLLGRIEPGRIPAPVLAGPRHLLLDEALRLGGPSALTRLRDTKGDVGTRLVAASGVAEDSLLSSWHHRMVTTRGTGIRPPAGVALASLGWLMLLGTLSLRRTRRCG